MNNLHVSDDLGLVHLLLSYSDPNIANNQGQTPLMLAARGGLLEVVQTLLETGGRVDAGKRDEDGSTALHYACESGNVDIVNLLLVDNVDNINACNNQGHTPLDVAAEKEHYLCVEALLAYSSDT